MEKPDPFETAEDYQNWHVLRRVGSKGLAQARTGEHWGGILGVQSRERQSILKGLIEKNEITPIQIEEIPNQIYYMRTQDLPTLETIRSGSQPKAGAAFIAALDNLIWNRGVIQNIFDFEYIWEVYKPKAQRKYGYYVLPVIYGDQFVARLDPSFDKKKRILTLNNWWWEAGLQPHDEMYAALSACTQDFAAYLAADQIILGAELQKTASLQWLRESL